MDNLKGKRIKLISMDNDPNPIEPGSEGEVLLADKMQIIVKWDNGRSLSLIPGVDKYQILN
jgi:hypothetical protein